MDTLIENPEVTVHANAQWPGADVPAISVIAPTFKYNASRLLESLGRQITDQPFEVLLYDDGSMSPSLNDTHRQAIEALPVPAQFISAKTNVGRSLARNALIARARSDWILLMDADMLPDTYSFISSYLSAIGSLAQNRAAAICGGFSLQQASSTSETRLHVAQSLASECLPSEERQKQPGLSIFTSNALVHKDVLKQTPFDPGFSGWGWEDVDWGIRIGQSFPIYHINNTATHLGLDRDHDLVRKYGSAGDNFRRLMALHPVETDQMKLARLVKKLRSMPALSQFASMSRSAALTRWLPLRIRLAALKAFRTFTYAKDAK